MKRVVVSGMGIVSSIGADAKEVASSLYDARSGITASPEFAEHGFRCRVHGIPQVDPFEILDRRTVRFMSRATAWNYLAMQQAIEDSGLEKDDIVNPKTGIIMGAGGPSTQTIYESAAKTLETGSPKRIGPLAVPKAMSSSPSAVLATLFEIKGVNYSISSACATSNHCLGNAYETIQTGKQEIIFAGGSEDPHWTMSNLFDAMGAMASKYNETPAIASRAFDKDRNGFVIAGGAGVLVLEEMERARARGAKIYGEIVGYGATSDGYDMVAPSGEGAKRCMQAALETVGESLDYINPHATSTEVGDEKEVSALRELFGDKCAPVSATKSLTGHSLGATGVQEAIYCLLMMRDNFICESAHIDELDSDFADMPIARERIENIELNTVLSNSFGFGGTNASIAFQRVS